MAARKVVQLVLALGLSACGGGGGGTAPVSTASPPTPAPAPAPVPAPAPAPTPAPAPAPTPPPAPPPPPPPPPGAPAAPVFTAPVNFADGLIATQTAAVNAPGAAAVEFQVDAAAVGRVNAPPFQVSFNAAAYVDGQHIVRARALSATGVASSWSSVTVRTASGNKVDGGFTKVENWVSGLTRATAIAQASDGRIFVTEQGGTLRVVKNGVLLPTPAVALATDSFDERGLLGLTLHPDFASNGWVYLYYAPANAPIHNRVSRIRLVGDVWDGTEVVIADLPPVTTASHSGGAMHFGADGKLYVSVGDDFVTSTPQDLGSIFGKLLRFNEDGSIPGDNPFCTQPQQRCAIYAYGLRSPFTFGVQPGTGRMLLNDVGDSTWEEIDEVHAGANFGWPISEGVNNLSPGITAPLFAYNHQPTVPPGIGPGGFLTGHAVVGSAFYPDTGAYPASYRGNYYFADYVASWVSRLDLVNGNVAYSFAKMDVPPVNLLAGSDGALYVLSRTSIARISSP